MLGYDPYYDRPECSNSDLSKIKKELYGGDDIDPTAAYRFGNLIDHMITEQWKVDYTNKVCAGEQFTDDEWYTALEMKKAFFRDPMCKQMAEMASPQAVTIKHGKEFTYKVWTFKLNVRAKWDLLFRQLGWGADIKSTTATTQKQFEAACEYFDYYRSRVFYMNVIDSKQDMLIGISKKNFKVFKIPIKRGDKLFKKGESQMNWLALEAWKLGYGQ